MLDARSDESCDIRLYALGVSRVHAEINIDALTDKVRTPPPLLTPA